MRPHVELVDVRDLLWHPAEFPHAEGEARQQNLCYDEEDGSASLRVEFLSDWRRPAGLHQAFTEWYVLEGEVRLGDKALSANDYWCAPKGILTPAIEVSAGSKILLFREYGDWTFTPASGNGPEARSFDQLTVCSSDGQDWYDVTDPEHGSPMDFERGGTPVPGLFIKMLYHDVETGFYTRLIRAKPGWREHPLAHHPCFEEAYCLDGTFDYNFGEMVKDQYFFRPRGVRHGDFTAGPEGTVWLLRCDGQLVDWYTDNASIELKGDPVNWGEDYPNTEPPEPVLPVRSRSVGPMKRPDYM
jgi:hypothetical protein